jgi:putative ATP-binding cassette transporter
MMFLPQRPYMSLGTLRSQLLYPRANANIGDEQLLAVLQQVNLSSVVENVGGLDAEQDWTEFLSVGEQQRLSFARILVHKPPYVILDEATSGLDMENEQRLYSHLKASGVTFISVGHRSSLLKFHDLALEIHHVGTWQLQAAQEYKQPEYPQFFDATPSPIAVV